jgi:hypothetical protein
MERAAGFVTSLEGRPPLIAATNSQKWWRTAYGLGGQHVAVRAIRLHLEIFESTRPRGRSKIADPRKLRSRQYKTFDARNFLCVWIMTFVKVELPALLRTVMSNARTHITETALRVRPLIRVASWSCVSVMTLGPNCQLEAGLFRKARV